MWVYIKMAKIPLIFKRFPDLAQTIDWLDLDLTTAPVHRLGHMEHDNLWIKRTDLVSTVIGGNKVGRLEFILADVRRQKKDHIITLGGIGSNHCLAVAIFCRRLGIRCTLCLFEQPLTRYVRENLRLFHYFGAKLIFAGSLWRSVLDFYLRLKRRHPDAFFLEAGGASDIGVLGAVNAALELKQQIDNNELPRPAFIFYPTASNAGMAGLSLGLQLTGVKATVVGVRTGRARLGPVPLNTPGTVRNRIKKTGRFLKTKSRMVPGIKVPEPVMLDQYCGQGYGFPTEKGMKALQVFKQREHIMLEPVYTAKTCAALLDMLKREPFSQKPILYWHTYHSVDFSKEAATVDYRELPPELHWCFQEKHQPDEPLTGR
ncbi:MAG: pyridoxal-phosphate dependent enzyme [bacterium]